MPPVVAEDTLSCQLTWSTAGYFDHAPQNVFAIHYPDDTSFISQALVDAIGDAFDAAWVAEAPITAWPATVSPDTLVVTDIRTATAAQYQTSLVSATSGTGDPLPGEIAAVTSFHTALRGRSYRGRFYWPAMLEGQNTSLGTLNSGTATALTDFWNAFRILVEGIAIPVGEMELAVHSRLLGVSTPVTSFTTDDHWDSQRRRGLR